MPLLLKNCVDGQDPEILELTASEPLSLDEDSKLHSLLLVAMPGATSRILAPSSDALCSQ